MFRNYVVNNYFGTFIKEAVSKKEFNKKVGRKISHMDDAHPEWKHDQVVAASINDVKDDIQDKGGTLPPGTEKRSAAMCPSSMKKAIKKKKLKKLAREYIDSDWAKDFVNTFREAGFDIKPYKTSSSKLEKTSAPKIKALKPKQAWKRLKDVSKRGGKTTAWDYSHDSGLFSGDDPTDKLAELITGGKADKENVTESDVNPEELKMGIKVELEHTPNKLMAKEIALDHLSELDDYYTRLKRVNEDKS